MTLRHAISLSFAAALFGAGFASAANAATVHHPHRVSHGARHVVMHHSNRARHATNDADHSADSLNAQSLAQHGQSPAR